MKTRLSDNFTLEEFSKTSAPYDNVIDFREYIDNIKYGVIHILQPARDKINSPIKINSGFRNILVNAYFGGAKNSQHLTGCAADITCSKEHFQELIYYLRHNPYVDQLLTAPTWCHVSWSPHRPPRHDIHINYYL